MPKAYLKCIKEGGQVRTITGPRAKNPKLKANQYIHVCVAPDGGRYWGEIKTKKQKTSPPKAKKILKLEEVTSQVLETLDIAQLYEVHRKSHLLWDKNTKESRKDIVNAHDLVVQEYESREMIHHQINSLDII